ncbi:MipA/OmpV family protein [Budvicia diplopodorum]|uniref:MipA/OmpV family protein n=1 Tax=Budvicia diplopodorum TaxID=1119056 RepID=UPI001357B647|nr:MipA/OmpV family protein [Budvicia diplopodorum]
MKFNQVILGSFVLSASLLSPVVNAADKTWTLGASATFELYPYKGVDNEVKPFPAISYEGDNFFVRGTGAGAYLWNDKENQLALNLFYSPLHFKPSNSDDRQMKELDKRRSTMMGGVSYKHIADWGTIRTSLSADMLNTSNGLYADAAYLHPIKLNNLKLTPGVGASWYSGNFNDYYYGVSGNESRRSGLDRYEAGSSWAPYAELTANYALDDNWSVFASGRYTVLDSEVKDSPMVDQSYSAFIATGVTYSF